MDVACADKPVPGTWLMRIKTVDGPVTARLAMNVDGTNVHSTLNWTRETVMLTSTITPDELRLTGEFQTLK